MPEPRAKPDLDRSRASRTRRGDAALVAQYIHELSERHAMGVAGSVPAGVEAARDGVGREEGG